MKSLKLLMALIVLIVFTGCYKQKDTVAIIIVKDQNGNVVSNATVQMYGSGTLGDVETSYEGITNASGEAHFNLNERYQPGQAGVTVLDIYVEKNSKEAIGIIKIEQEETTKKLVYINL